MPAALTHTRITWSLSPMAPQVPGVTPGSPLRPWCWGHSLWRGARHASSLWVLEHFLVVGCVLGMVRLEVRLIAGLLSWSSGKS
jgi:hypothetical protein